MARACVRLRQILVSLPQILVPYNREYEDNTVAQAERILHLLLMVVVCGGGGVSSSSSSSSVNQTKTKKQQQLTFLYQISPNH